MIFAIVVLMGVGSFFQSNHQMIVAYISVDINPSVEFGIDINDMVVEANGLNQEGIYCRSCRNDCDYQYIS